MYDHAWKDDVRQPDHLPPDPSYNFSWESVIGVGLVFSCVVDMAVIVADDLNGIGTADDFLFGPLSTGAGKGLIMILE